MSPIHLYKCNKNSNQGFSHSRDCYSFTVFTRMHTVHRQLNGTNGLKRDKWTCPGRMDLNGTKELNGTNGLEWDKLT